MKFQELTFGQIRIDDTEYRYNITGVTLAFAICRLEQTSRLRA